MLPTGKGDEAPCARKILGTLARRAFRRPVTNADLEPLLGFHERGRAPKAISRKASSTRSRALLVSPDFLLRHRSRPIALPAGAVYRVNDLDLASRLPFFLWSSIPTRSCWGWPRRSDCTSRSPSCGSRFNGCFADPRSEALVQNFGGQWLQLRNLETVTPDPDVFPNFDDGLRQAFRRETELFFESILREDRSVLQLLDADYTFLNQRLADHYGVRGVYGPQFRRVALDDATRAWRGGLLGGSILTVTSYPEPDVGRAAGKWILENLLGTPRLLRRRRARSETEGHDGRFTEHARNSSTCTAPTPSALRATRGWTRSASPSKITTASAAGTMKDAGFPIDARAKLPDGKTFNGPSELKKILLTDHRDEFVTTVTENC